MSEQRIEKEQNTGTLYPFIQSTTDAELRNDFVRMYDLPPRYTAECLSLNILTVLAAVPIFHPLMLYEVLGYTTSRKTVAMILSRMEKNGFVKSVSVKSDSEINTLYYITKAGFIKATQDLYNEREYFGKTGKRLSETGMHELGVGYSLVALARSPMKVRGIQYETPITFSKSVMPTGKFLKRNLRPDAIYDIESEHVRGKIYLEHDTGSESVVQMTEKLVLYPAHDLMEEDVVDIRFPWNKRMTGMILYTFRTVNDTRAECFRLSRLKRLIAAIPDDMDICAFSQVAEDGLKPTLEALKVMTPAFKKHWHKNDLSSFMSRVDAMTEPLLLKRLKKNQMIKTAARRDSMVRLLLQEYGKYVSKEHTLYAAALSKMLSGYRVGFSAVSHISDALPMYFLSDYPGAQEWVMSALEPYYGSLRYTFDSYRFENVNPGKEPITFRNVFHSEDKNLDVCVEYLSGDVSAIIRMRAFLSGSYASSSKIHVVMVVDDFFDALRIGRLIDPDTDRGFRVAYPSIIYESTFGSFLNLGSSYLYMLDEAGKKEVRLPVLKTTPH